MCSTDREMGTVAPFISRVEEECVVASPVPIMDFVGVSYNC